MKGWKGREKGEGEQKGVGGKEEGKKGGRRVGGKREKKTWRVKGKRGRDRKEELYMDLGKEHSQKRDHQV